jgi:hypothetical protein
VKVVQTLSGADIISDFSLLVARSATIEGNHNVSKVKTKGV